MGVRSERGQILPGLLVLMVAILALGLLAFQVGKAAVLRSDAQTAADAAALAGAGEIRRQLMAQWATLGYTDMGLVNRALVAAAAADYARRNDAVLAGPPEIIGVDVRVKVRTVADLGRDARSADSENVRGEARARARVSLLASFPTSAGSIGGLPGGGGTPRISGEEWEEFGKTIGKPPGCADVVKLGRLLQAHGFAVSENAFFGGIQYDHADGGYHYRCNNAGALDVNFGGPGDLNPAEVGAVDPIIKPLNDLGFRTIWRAPDHYNHLHVDIGRSGPIGAGFGNLGGFTGPLEDAFLTVKLVDWDAPLAPLLGFAGGGTYSGPPDPAVARVICEVAGPAGDKILLAAFEAAIVESGVHNLTYGHADSLGVFQQRPSVGEWGSARQIMDPVHATRAFVRTARSMDRPGLSAGALAANVQRPAWQYRGRYAQVEGQARALIAEFCK